VNGIDDLQNGNGFVDSFEARRTEKP